MATSQSSPRLQKALHARIDVYMRPHHPEQKLPTAEAEDKQVQGSCRMGSINLRLGWPLRGISV